MKSTIVKINKALLNDLKKATQVIMKSHDIKSNADLLKSVTWVVTKEGTLSLEANDYFDVVNVGRKKGSMPPAQDLIPWLKKNAISPRNGQSYNELAFIIANSIKKFGTKGKFYTEPIVDVSTDIIAEELATEISENICNELVAALEN
jgi:hypothetical protein